MIKPVWTVIILGLWMAGTTGVVADEAGGKVSATGYGSFKLDVEGTVRQFSLSSTKSQYEPASWRPTKQDQVTVAFTPSQGKKEPILWVDKVKLVKAGPQTIVMVDSPAAVEITEAGTSGLTAKLASGQTAKFSYRREMERSPAGWNPTAGDKARITFRPQPTLLFTVSFVLDRMEKIP